MQPSSHFACTRNSYEFYLFGNVVSCPGFNGFFPKLPSSPVFIPHIQESNWASFLRSLYISGAASNTTDTKTVFLEVLPMDSDILPRKEATLSWADLPPKALAIISTKFLIPEQIRRLRSVCRSWRSSIAPHGYKFCPIFPFTYSLLGLGEPMVPTVTISVSAIYLVQSHSNPTKLYLVSVTEVAPGKLIICHPLTYQEIKTKTDAAAATTSITIVPSGFSTACVIRRPSGTPLGFVGLCARKDITVKHLFAFTVDKSPTRAKPLLVGDSQCCCEFVSYVIFERQVFAIDRQGRIYVLRPEMLRANKLKLDEIGILKGAERAKKDLVVSNGGLSLVSTLYEEYCRIYKLYVDKSSLDKVFYDRTGHIVMKKVANVGEDIVVFIGMACTFSVPARVLPRPWKGNCIVYLDVPSSTCGCNRSAAECGDQIRVVQLAGAGADETQLKFNKISELEGYSDLFSPPLLDMPPSP